MVRIDTIKWNALLVGPLSNFPDVRLIIWPMWDSYFTFGLIWLLDKHMVGVKGIVLVVFSGSGTEQ